MHMPNPPQARPALAAMESSSARWSDILNEADLRALLEARATALLREEQVARQEAAAAFMVRRCLLLRCAHVCMDVSAYCCVTLSVCLLTRL